MTRSGSKTPSPVPRLHGWTTSGECGRARNSRSHQRRCASTTAVTMRLREVTANARCNDICKRDRPPSSEQYCFGVERPLVSVVKACRRCPSPPAKTTAQMFRLRLTLEPPKRSAELEGDIKPIGLIGEAILGLYGISITRYRVIAISAASPARRAAARVPVEEKLRNRGGLAAPSYRPWREAQSAARGHLRRQSRARARRGGSGPRQ